MTPPRAPGARGGTIRPQMRPPRSLATKAATKPRTTKGLCDDGAPRARRRYAPEHAETQGVQDSPPTKRECRSERWLSVDERPAIPPRIRQHQDHCIDACGVSLLKNCSDLRLRIGQSRYHLDRNARALVDEHRVEGAAPVVDGPFRADRPEGANERAQSIQGCKLRPVAQRRAIRMRPKVDSQANHRRVPGEHQHARSAQPTCLEPQDGAL